MTILVTGGAGYIGSHTVAELLAHGETVVVVDHMGQGHRDAVIGAPLYEMDIRDSAGIVRVMQEHSVETVIHFAANSLVGESVQDPLKYYDNNVGGTQKLLSAMQAANVQRFVFSSSAATYGEPDVVPIPETHPQRPTNPYGETKLVIERMLYWCHGAWGLRSVSLRYFNAAGAHPTLPIGEHHDPETHLIPNVLMVALGQREFVPLFGTDYPTPDGTCVRDYVHVMDLASAHRLSVQRLRTHDVVEAYNLGSGSGYSNRQIIDAVRRVTGHPIPVQEQARRGGDPAVLIASSAMAREKLLWQPQYDDIDAMIATAWQWHQGHPHGFSN